MKLSNMNIDELTGAKYECSCGMTHSVNIDVVDISYDAIENAVEYVVNNQKENITIICDENTFRIAGKSFSEKLNIAGVEHVVQILEGRNGHNVTPNDACLGEALAKIRMGTDFFIAIGSGVVNDLTRQISYKMGVEYMVIATAPSMDGYASVTSSLILNNVKQSIDGQYPKAIFGPLDILKAAPYKMLTAGFGDVIGKYNALREWKFGRDYKKEHYCLEIVELVEKVVDKCRENAARLTSRDENAVASIMDGLVLAGMAMGLYQNTRPASGAEHHIVHYWDVDCIRHGKEHELHGNSVGIGTVVICRLFDIVRDKLPVEVADVNTKEIEKILKLAGCMTTPQEAGIERSLFKESILKGHTMSSKFTVLTYLNQENPDLLKEVAEKLCIEFYDNV
ncbi:MAG: sn-glycerol-1-phosphate dehydrogenase [Clostridiales bacterium]|nr:sn-glycerol-1-phosphate dehydrogenase [Clostridiales bacterium]